MGVPPSSVGACCSAQPCRGSSRGASPGSDYSTPTPRHRTASGCGFREACLGRVVRAVAVGAGAADDDLVLFDDDLDRAVAGPVLGVHGVVLDGGVQPQAVALLA